MGGALTLNKNGIFLESNLHENSLVLTSLPPGSRMLSALDLKPSKSCYVNKPWNTLNKEHVDVAPSECSERVRTDYCVWVDSHCDFRVARIH